MTTVSPAAHPGTSQQAVVDAALLLLERMGLSPEDLVAVPRERPLLPTFAEYVPVVSATVTAGTRRAYGSYWNRVLEHWGSRRLDEPSPSEIGQLMAYVKTHVVARRNACGGRSAAEHLVAALRCLYRHAEDDGLITEAGNPARKVAKPRRLPSTRRAVADARLAEINEVAATTGDDPGLDTLLLRLHTETACRRGGALALRPQDLDPDQCLILLREKGETVRWQPVSPSWVGIAQKTGFGLVSPLPGIWPALYLNTAVTLPVGVEAYAAYALRAWLTHEQAVSDGTRRFAKWSAICSFALGMAGQVTYHLLAQAGAVRAPWGITTLVSCLPVLVLAMGTALAHMLRADAAAADRSSAITGDAPDSTTGGPAGRRSAAWSARDQTRVQFAGDGTADVPGAEGRTARSRRGDRDDLTGPVTAPDAQTALSGQPKLDQARLIARRLATTGTPVSRRILRSNGVRGSNAWLGALAHTVNAELAGAAAANDADPPG